MRGLPGSAVLLAVLLVSACGQAATLRITDVQGQIVEGLVEQVGGRFSVVCPSSVPVEQGRSFSCSVTDLADGTLVEVVVTQEDGAGAFSWRVTREPGDTLQQ